MDMKQLFVAFANITWLSSLLYIIHSYTSTQEDNAPKTLNLYGVYNLANSESRFLASLGFVPEPRLYPQSHHENAELPVFVLALHSEHLHSFHRFLGSFRVYFRTKRLVVYDIGLSDVDRDLVQHTCQCLVRSVHWERYPSHVRDLRTKAYRPFLIQETLQEFGAVFWCHPAMRFNSSELDVLTRSAQFHGVVTWRARKHPVSAFTHPYTLRFFKTESSMFNFHPMAEPDMALYYNTYILHNKLMLPWIKCAIEEDCISPSGSQNTGCKVDKENWFAFTGCHLYDSSAFNVLLGLMFKYKTPYIASKKIFKIES